MNTDCLVAVFDSKELAQQAVHVLDRGDFPTDQVSLVATGLPDPPHLAEDLSLQDDSGRAAAIGAGLGAIVGVLAGIAVTMVSGLGLVFLAGPIGGGLVGATTGGFLGGLSGWGVHGERIRHYEKLVKAGKVLVIAHGNPGELARAQRMLGETNPDEMHMYGAADTEVPGAGV
ncbi:MAG: hypothetical protein KDA44_01580 [Planctomycetales bacterium]|nr:hypothetical protein [Planctomycetales bacterium]